MPAMSVTGRRAAILTLAVLELALGAGLFARQAVDRRRAGWAGLAFVAADMPGMGDIAVVPGLGGKGRRVLIVVPGSPADRAGMRAGDAIASINGVPLPQVGRLVRLGRTLAAGDTALYRVERHARAMDLPVLLGTVVGSPAILAGIATSLVAGCAFLLIGLLVAWARPGSAAALIFFLTAASGAASYFAWGVSQLCFPDLAGLVPLGAEPVGLGVILTLLVLSVVMANLLLHLSMVFPRVRPLLERWPEVALWIHTLPLLPLALGAAFVGGGAAGSLGPVGWGLELATAALLAVALVRLGRRQRALGPWRAFLTSPGPVQLAAVALAALVGPGVSLLPDSIGIWSGVIAGITAVTLTLGLLVAWSILTCVVLHRGHRDGSREEKLQVRWVVWAATAAFAGSAVLAALAVASSSLLGDGVGAEILSLGLVSLSQLVWVVVPASFALVTRPTWRGAGSPA
jgi:hypothetical protein